MSLNGSHSDENDMKIGSMVSVNNQALESEEMEKCDFMSGIDEKDHLIIPSDDEIEKSFRVNQDGSMTVEMKVRLTIKQEEMIHWTTTVSRAGVNSQEMAAFSQPVSSNNSPNNKDNNNNRTRQSNMDSYGSKNENTQSCKPIKLNKEGENHCGSATSEALENSKPCFRRPSTPGPRSVRRKETSVENIKRRSQTEVQESKVGMSEVLQLHNKGKEITETVMHIHHSQDRCGNYLAKSWADEDDGFEFMSQEHKKPDSTESGPQSSSNDCDTDLTKLSGSGNSRNNGLLSLPSGQSDLSQTISTFTDYENQARCESSDKGVEISTKKDSENKRGLSKRTKMAQESEKSNKHVFLKSTVSDKKQKGSVPESVTESDRYWQKVKKRKKGQLPEKINTKGHSNMLMDTSQNINFGRNNMLRPYVKEKLDVFPSSHSAPFKILTKQRSVNGGITKSPKESKELSESVSMPVLHSSPYNVHQYVENWLEKNHPESVPYMDELNPHESRAMFQIESDFSDVSEMGSELDKDNLVENCYSVEGSPVQKPVSQQLLQIRCVAEPVETQNLGRFCKSMPSVRMHTAEQETGRRKNKSSEDFPKLQLPNAGNETLPNTQLIRRSGMKQVLEQLCLSIKYIRRACSHSYLSSLNTKKKSSSLPDFSSQLASVFGSPSKTLLSFLTVMTLRDVIANFANENLDSANSNNSGSNPEALQVMQSIQKLASIEDKEELKASLASLHRSTSAQLKKSLKDFQEKNDIKESPLMSPRQSEQEFALEVNSEEEDQDKGHIFGIREVMDELNMCEDLRREISSLVRRDLTNFNGADPAMEHSGHENQTNSIACENENAIIKDDTEGSSEEERKHSEESVSEYDDITNTKPAESSKEFEEFHLLKSSSIAMKESDGVENVKFEDMTNQEGLIVQINEIMDDVKTNQERYVNNKPSKEDLCEVKQDMMENVQMIGEKYPEDEISLADEVQTLDYSPSNLEDQVEWQEHVGCMQSESELLSPTSEMANSEVIDETFSKRGDCTDSLEECGMHSKDEDTYCESREYAEQENFTSMASETETAEAHHANISPIQTEEKDSMHNAARLGASSFSVDEAGSHNTDDDGPKEVGINSDHEETMCSITECENPPAKPHHSSVSDQEDKNSHTHSHTWQESETEPELQKSEEEQTHNANENDEEADEDEDFDPEPNSPLYVHQESEYSDHFYSVSSKGREMLAELDLQSLDEESISKNPPLTAEEKVDKTDELDDKQSNVVDTNKVLDTQSHQCFLEDPPNEGFLAGKSCKIKDKNKAQSDSADLEEANMDHECHYVHPTVFPQQLLDFVNLALKSSALIFTYDSNGFLRIEPDRCKNRIMSLTKSNVGNQYTRTCLPSPNTSDLSDYRPDTSDSGGDLSRVSTDMFTESGEDEAERLFIYQGNMKQNSENMDRKVKSLDNVSKKTHPATKQIASPNLKSSNSLSSFPDSMVNSTMQDPVYCNSSDSIGNPELAQCLAFHTKTDSEEGILIDKGRWLLKENHLIRKSPPVPMGMYENVDTTSVDTGHTNEDVPYIPCGIQQSQLAVISSSELEDMTKPSTPKCTYFNMSHSSDSDPFLDNQSVTSNRGRGFNRKSKEVSPMGETARMCAQKNGSLPSFSAVEFKLASGKVHPADSMSSSVVEKSAKSQSLRCNTPHEEESVEGLSLRCGQHCPIL
ncbi:hypothetical protein QTP70_007688 [Hemibagrus guttatus]|uniref:Uncharacterized protein n=1 Tax=Hemibagrus guttatus TaxID=175788 RepID=A0AAE0VAP5_9TELE|nr:hypothetical protein QTP70_007688 [Hemibagrus guttatus]